MKSLKILSVAIVSMFVTSAALAGGAIGITAAISNVEASGFEKLKTSANKTTHSTSEGTVIPSIFFEKDINESLGIAIGIDIIPVKANVGSGSNLGDDDAETSGTNKVTANFKNHITLYLVKDLVGGAYIKAGWHNVTLTTDDEMSTGAAYGDQSLNGVTVGLGIERDLANDTFLKVEAAYSDYDSATFKSTSSDAVTTVELEELDVTQLRISVGKRF
jgi:opacity protein-like surface antigen